MNANELAQAVAEMEGKIDPQNIAQIKEVLKCANKIVGGKLYRAAKDSPAALWITKQKKGK